MILYKYRFLPYRIQSVDYTKIKNEKCKEKQSREISTADFNLSTMNINNENYDGPPKLELKLGPESVDYLNFVSQGFQSLKGKRIVNETIDVREIELTPKINGKETWFSIDKESFEAKPIKITLLPQIISLFCRKDVS